MLLTNRKYSGRAVRSHFGQICTDPFPNDQSCGSIHSGFIYSWFRHLTNPKPIVKRTKKTEITKQIS